MNIRKFNQLYADPANKTLIQKALTSATDVGEALIPEHLVDVITNTAVRLVPELAIPILKFDRQKWHDFNRLVEIPGAGSAMGENSVTPIRNSSYKRTSVQMKIMKRKGSVTGFQVDASADYLDSEAAEMENHVQAFGNDLRTYMLYGNKGADEYSFDGLDVFIATNRDNLSGSDQVQTTLELLDKMIDENTSRQGQPHRKVFLVSPPMLSALTRLWTNVRDTRPAQRQGTSVVEVSGGYRLETYRGIPFLETSATRPNPNEDMGVVALASAGAGGAIPDDEYFFRVSPITWDGEQITSASSNSITTTGSDTITLSFSAIKNALYYKVYAGDAAGNEKLVKVVSAFTYDSAGTVTGKVTSIVFNSNPLVVDSASVPTHMENDIPYVRDATSNEPMETLILWDLDEFQGLGKMAYTNSAGSRLKGLITTKEISPQDDNFPFLLKCYSALIDSFEATSYLVRGIRTK